jgi:aspartate kinase
VTRYNELHCAWTALYTARSLAGLRTTGEFGNAEILDESYSKIKEVMRNFDDNSVAVVTGFIGHSPDGKITTLGR